MSAKKTTDNARARKIDWEDVQAEARRRYRTRFERAFTDVDEKYLVSFVGSIRDDIDNDASRHFRALRDAVNGAAAFVARHRFEPGTHGHGVRVEALLRLAPSWKRTLDFVVERATDGVEGEWAQWFDHVEPVYGELSNLDHAILRILSGRHDGEQAALLSGARLTVARVIEKVAKRVKDARRTLGGSATP